MEKAMSRLELVDLSKHNFRQTLDSLQEGAHSVLMLTIQWKEIEGYFDSTKTALKEQAKKLEALEESIKGKALELEAKEKEIGSIEESLKEKFSDFEKKESEFHLTQKAAIEKRSEEVEQYERFKQRTKSIEKLSVEKLLELNAKAQELESKVKEVEKQKDEISVGEKLRLEFEPLVSLLTKNLTMPASCSSFYLNEKATDFADDLVKKNIALARMIPFLDPAKLVFDAIEGSFKEYLNKDFGESDDVIDSVFNSCIVLLEKLIHINPKISPKLRQEATQLGFDWIEKAKTNPDNDSRVLGCLLFLAVYGLSGVTTREVLLPLVERFLTYDQAPELFQLLKLEDKVPGVVETLKKKEEYLAALRFICEFRLYKLCPGGRPEALVNEYLDSSEKASRVMAGTQNLMEAQKARREKRKADAAMALKCIREKKAGSMFPPKTLKKLAVLAKIGSIQRPTLPDHKHDEKGQSTINAVEKSEADSTIPYAQKSEAKRQRLTELTTSVQNSTVNPLRGVSVPSGEKIEESGVNHQPDDKVTYPLSTETKTKIVSGSISAALLRELLDKQPLDESELSNAIKSSLDPAKLFLDTSLALYPRNPKEGYKFKQLITSAKCSLLLDQLKKLPLRIEHPVREDAKRRAGYWKDTISKNKTDELEVVCFLQFLGIFGIVSEFKANDLLSLLENPYWRTVSPDLCEFLGLVDDIPGFIQNLIITGYRIKAVYYIYSFDMVGRFQPVSALINDSLRITKESAEKSLRDAKNESARRALQVAAIDKQIKSVRAAIKCIKFHKLESEFQLETLGEQMKSLLKLRRNPSEGSGSGPKPEQTQLAKPPNVSEIGSVTSNTPLEPSTASVSSSMRNPNKKRGQKRRLSGSNQRTGHVASHTSNHYPRHGYSMNQRPHWPVNDYRRGGFTGNPNSDYNYKQRIQPDGAQFHQFYQHPNPIYRNQF